MLYLRNTNQLQTLADNISGGIQRGTLPNISASVTSSCVDYDGSGIVDINDIVGGKGPIYNYSLYDLSSSLFITQSTTVSSASIDDLFNSTYLVKVDNLGLFPFTQSVVVNCPPPPDLNIEYLVVGGGGKVNITGYGGGAGGFLTGSLSLGWNETLTTTVGLGASGSILSGSASSISSSLLFAAASGGVAGDSGYPTINQAGLGGPAPIGNGGGAGAGEDGVDGIEGLSGRGGNGLQWLNGIYYAGGGGGAGGGTFDAGAGGNGGGGQGEPDVNCPTCPTGSNGLDGFGGGAGGGNYSGGSGTVIIRYSTGSVRPAYGGTVTEVGGYIYHTFTGSGQFTYSKQ